MEPAGRGLSGTCRLRTRTRAQRSAAQSLGAAALQASGGPRMESCLHPALESRKHVSPGPARRSWRRSAPPLPWTLLRPPRVSPTCGRAAPPSARASLSLRPQRPRWPRAPLSCLGPPTLCRLAPGKGASSKYPQHLSCGSFERRGRQINYLASSFPSIKDIDSCAAKSPVSRGPAHFPASPTV